MPIGVFAKTFSRNSVLEVLQAVKQYGFEVAHFNFACMGLSDIPAEIPDAAILEIQAAKAATGIELVGVSATFNMAHPEEQVRKTGLKSLEKIAAAGRELGIPLISLCTGSRNMADKWAFHPDNNSREAWVDMVQSTEAAVAIAERYDVVLGIEPELGNVISNPEKAALLLKEMASDRLKIILDPANLFEEARPDEIKSLITDAIELLGPHIAMAHAKDRTAAGGFAAPGKGVIPFGFFVDQLEAAGLNCPLVAHGLDEGEAATVAQYLKKT